MKQRVKILSLLLALCLIVGLVPPVRAEGTMTVSDDLIEVLKTMEGFSAKPYWDYKQWTVGYGTECPEEKRAEYEKNGIPLEEAEALLRLELDGFEADVLSFAAKHGLTLKQQEFDALVSLTYNCGPGWMDGTNGYLNNAVRAGFRGTDFLYAICLYSKAGGDYILQNRRLCEANIYLNGVYRAYNSGGNAIPVDYRYVYLDGNGGTVTYPICAYDAGEESGICVEFSQIPTGKKADGTPYPYTLEGWYTAGGEKVEKLDGSLERGTVLYANWTDNEGKQVSLSKGEAMSMEVEVTAETVNIRTGPATFYPKLTAATQGTKLQLSQVYDGWGKSQLGWLKLTNTNYSTVIASQPMSAKVGTVTGSRVNYRNGPSTSGTTVMGQKVKGDRVTIVQIDYSSDPAWGKMDNGYWIRLDYVQFDEDVTPTVTGVTVVQLPQKTEYLHKTEAFRPEGGVLLATLSDGTAKAASIKRSMVSSFSNETVGNTTVRGSWEGFAFSFQVEILGHPVTFQYGDGTVIQTQRYPLGAEVIAPTPLPPSGYIFKGWDQEVTPCAGSAVYTALFEKQPVTGPVTGDLTGNDIVDEDDAVYLLQHVLLPERFPLSEAVDYTGNGIVDEDDAVFLLQHVLLPERFPLEGA